MSRSWAHDLLWLQQYFVCDYAINVDCQAAESYYGLNDNFGRVLDSKESEPVIV